MERIREALKRAREERNAKVIGLDRGSAPASGSTEGVGGALGEIAYSLRGIEVSRELLFDKRVVSGFDQNVNNVCADAFKIISTQVLQRLRENGWNTLMVTSPGEHEGKTLIAVNLALSLAMEVDQTVLLVDAAVEFV
jgi:protein-tyrosine kinase